MSEPEILTGLPEGTLVLVGGTRAVRVSAELAAAYRPGDTLLAVPGTGDLLHVPAAAATAARAAVDRAEAAFERMGAVSDTAISCFYEEFAARLADAAVWSAIAAANREDVQRARARGRSTTRLVATEGMREGMVRGLRAWRDAPPGRGRVMETVEHAGWRVRLLTAPLGVVGFVFEGRPNVFADATGVLRGGNTVVFRIGSDALGTARAIVEHALDPALAAAGLPEGAATLLDRPEHAAGWALFAEPRLALAVARGSGPAVAQLGAVARQAGVPVSLHGTGGAWLTADETAEPTRFRAAVYHSLDRKVCNTLNVCVLLREAAAYLAPYFLEALQAAGERLGHGARLHVTPAAAGLVPPAWFAEPIRVRRASGDVDEPRATLLEVEQLGREWEWEATPEVSLAMAEDLDAAIELCNRYSPRFIAALVSASPERQQRFYELVNAPFVGNGFTRWVDGQYALGRPELGLSNWEHGRLFARGAILSGDGVYTLRTRAELDDPDVHR